MAGLAKAGGGLDPAEDFFDPFAQSLADRVAGVAGGAAVDGRAAAAGVLRDVRGGAQPSARGP